MNWQPGLAAMTLSPTVVSGAGFAGRTTAVLLTVLLAIPTAARAAGESRPPLATPYPAAATAPVSLPLSAGAARPGFPAAVFAGIIGDRQRMVQVALIFMGVAILILTRGNRF
jgi:hypothetical protein